MEEKIKEIISAFIKIPSEQITLSTSIDRASVSSSIMLHRMYAKLAEQGFVIQDYSEVKNFRSLLTKLNGNINNNGSLSEQTITLSDNKSIVQSGMSIGIDIEEISAMPRTNDFREDEFYKMNFSSSEIAYCILQPDSYASFAGLFAAKEAIAKANNNYGKKNFNAISIDHSSDGKPVHDSFQLSISHTNNTAVAVAIENGFTASANSLNHENEIAHNKKNNTSVSLFIAFLSLILSAVALYLVFRR